MIASLGMYDGAGAREANDRLWTLISDRLERRGVPDVPPAIDRGRPLAAIWSDPALLFAQCCGYPLMTRYRDRLRVIATPRYTAPGCDGATHRSRIVVRSDDPAATLADLRDRRVAINAADSNTGMNLFRAAIAPLAGGRAFFRARIETGSHRASLAAVAAGEADVAAIDAVTFAHLESDEPALTNAVCTLAWTAATPTLPFVTSRDTPEPIVTALRDILTGIMAKPATASIRAALLLNGVAPAADYAPVLQLERDAVALGYPQLC